MQLLMHQGWAKAYQFYLMTSENDKALAPCTAIVTVIKQISAF